MAISTEKVSSTRPAEVIEQAKRVPATESATG